jgi:hypothetical protein
MVIHLVVRRLTSYIMYRMSSDTNKSCRFFVLHVYTQQRNMAMVATRRLYVLELESSIV